MDTSLVGLEDDDGFVWGRGRKRTKFFRQSGGWQYAERSPSPASTEQLSQDEGPPEINFEPSALPAVHGRVPATASSVPDSDLQAGILDQPQTPDLAEVQPGDDLVEGVQSEQARTGFVVPSLPVARIAAPKTPPQSGQKIAAVTPNAITPRLMPLPSPGLPLVSPLITSTGPSLDYFSQMPKSSPEPDTSAHNLSGEITAVVPNGEQSQNSSGGNVDVPALILPDLQGLASPTILQALHGTSIVSRTAAVASVTPEHVVTDELLVTPADMASIAVPEVAPTDVEIAKEEETLLQEEGNAALTVDTAEEGSHLPTATLQDEDLDMYGVSEEESSQRLAKGSAQPEIGMVLVSPDKNSDKLERSRSQSLRLQSSTVEVQAKKTPATSAETSPTSSRYSTDHNTKLEINAVECTYQGVEISPPPFPFKQAWDRGAIAEVGRQRRRKKQGRQYDGSADVSESEGESVVSGASPSDASDTASPRVDAQVDQDRSEPLSTHQHLSQSSVSDLDEASDAVPPVRDVGSSPNPMSDIPKTVDLVELSSEDEQIENGVDDSVRIDTETSSEIATEAQRPNQANTITKSESAEIPTASAGFEEQRRDEATEHSDVERQTATDLHSDNVMHLFDVRRQSLSSDGSYATHVHEALDTEAKILEKVQHSPMVGSIPSIATSSRNIQHTEDGSVGELPSAVVPPKIGSEEAAQAPSLVDATAVPFQEVKSMQPASHTASDRQLLTPNATQEDGSQPYLEKELARAELPTPQATQSFKEPDSSQPPPSSMDETNDRRSTTAEHRRSARLVDSARRSLGKMEVVSPWFTPRKPEQTQTSTKQGEEIIGTTPTVIGEAKDDPSGAPFESQKELTLIQDGHNGAPKSLEGVSTNQSAQVASPSKSWPKGFRTTYSYFPALSSLRSHFNQSIDIVALCTSASTVPKRAPSGPRDYHTTLHITDPTVSGLSTAHERFGSFYVQATTVQVFRPWRNALPSARKGDVVLLRHFKVQSRKREMMLLSTEGSAWVVLSGEDGKEEKINGPPVEFGEQERSYASKLQAWWKDIQTSRHVQHTTPTKEGTKSRGDVQVGPLPVTSNRASNEDQPLEHELRDGVTYTDAPNAISTKVGSYGTRSNSISPSPVKSYHVLRDGRRYLDPPLQSPSSMNAKPETAVSPTPATTTTHKGHSRRHSSRSASTVKSPEATKTSFHELRDGTTWTDDKERDDADARAQRDERVLLRATKSKKTAAAAAAVEEESSHELRDGTTYRDA